MPPAATAHGPALTVAVKPPVEGRANEALRRVLAKALRVRSHDVLVVQGERGKDKLIELRDTPPGTEDLLAFLF